MYLIITSVKLIGYLYPMHTTLLCIYIVNTVI